MPVFGGDLGVLEKVPSGERRKGQEKGEGEARKRWVDQSALILETFKFSAFFWAFILVLFFLERAGLL